MAQRLGTLHPLGRPGRGSWLGIGIASAIVLTWGVNQWTEDLTLCLSFLYIWLCTENKINLSFFFLKIYFYYFFIGKADIQRGRPSIWWFTPQVSTMADAIPIWSQETLLGLPRRCRVPKLSSSTAIPGHRQGAGREAGLLGLEPTPIWYPGRARRGP